MAALVAGGARFGVRTRIALQRGSPRLRSSRIRARDAPPREQATAQVQVQQQQQQQQQAQAPMTPEEQVTTVRLPQPAEWQWQPQGAGQHAFASSDNLHPVLDILERRMREGSRPGHRSDGFKLGLAVEGGGMRGIVTGAMLLSLLGHDTIRAFDVVYGASAGAMNSTYWLTRQPEGLDIYTEHLISERFLSLRRWWASEGPPPMDLDHLLEEIMAVHCPLDWHGVMQSEVPLKIVASSLDSLRAEVLSDFYSPRDLRECLAATARVPGIAGPPRVHRGHRLVDGAVFEPIPVKSAVRDGCTHVLALCSRAPDSGPAWGRLLSKAVEHSVKRLVLSPDWMRDAWRAEVAQRSQDGVDLDEWLADVAAGRATSTIDLCSSSGSSMDSGSATPNPGASMDGAALGCCVAGGSYVLPVHPTPALSFAPICQDVTSLMQGRKEGFEAMEKILVPLFAPRPRAR